MYPSFLMAFSYVVYLPMLWRLVIVDIYSSVVWLAFHYLADFARPVPLMMGILFPSMELYLFQIIVKNSWHAHKLLKSEKKARQLSDDLGQTLKGVFQVTYDASCEV